MSEQVCEEVHEKYGLHLELGLAAKAVATLQVFAQPDLPHVLAKILTRCMDHTYSKDTIEPCRSSPPVSTRLRSTSSSNYCKMRTTARFRVFV